MKLYSVKDGELECREVDADFFEKNTTLGGLLTSDEVELDLGNEKESPSNLNANSITTGTLNCSDMWWDPLTGIMQFANPTASDETELDQDDNTIKVNDENSGNSAFYEMAEKFREALDIATDYGYKLSVSIVDDNYTWCYHLPILDFKSMDSKQLFLADLDNVKVHDRMCLELNNIYGKKNADYGNSFENSLDKYGLIAGIVRMDDKMSRLISLNSKNELFFFFFILSDTLMDLANYAIMSVMWLDEQ